MTNGDFLRSKSNEGLAEFLGESMSCITCPIENTCRKSGESCFRNLVDWLNAPRPEPEEDHDKSVMVFCEAFNNRWEQEHKELQLLRESMQEATEACREYLEDLKIGLDRIADKLEKKDA